MCTVYNESIFDLIIHFVKKLLFDYFMSNVLTKNGFKSKTPKVYKNKKLNKANFGNFSHTDYQVFLHLVSKIGNVDEFGKYLQPEKLNREHTLSAKEFSNAFNTSIDNCYGFLKKACRKLMKTSIVIEKPELSEIWEINVCSIAKYNAGEGYIVVKFTDDIMPYLAQVRQKFVLYNLKEISNFNSIYTTRLYELIQEFKDTGWFIKTVAQLREVFAVGHNFKLYGDFKRYTFIHACKEINSNYDLDLQFEEQKEGKKVVAIKFCFKPIVILKVTNQKTGLDRTLHKKPTLKQKKVTKKNRISGIRKLSEILEGQLSFKNIESSKNISFISKLKSIFTNKKKK